MQYPFSMCGKLIQIYRFTVTYQKSYEWLDENGIPETKTETSTEYCHTKEQSETVVKLTDGIVTQLDTSNYEWMDGLEVSDALDTYAEAVKLYEMGKDAYFSLKQAEKQQENNVALAQYLKTHYITWNDGKKYGVTQEDQQEMALNLTQYQLCQTAGVPSKLEWHAVHEECREFTQEELTALALEISAYVYPLIRKNQATKVKIYACTSLKELKGIVIDYEEMV